jgi:hypothetical protein
MKRLDIIITVVVIVVIVFAVTHQQAAKEILIPLVRSVR